MIAVFGSAQEFSIIKCLPRKKYILIRDIESIRGVRWEGVMLLPGWYQKKRLCEAMEALEIRQPELFEQNDLYL
jgi:hypothetical protein